MRSFRGHRASSTLPTLLGTRVPSPSKASLAHTVEEFRETGTDALSNSTLGSLNGGSVSGTSCLKAVDCILARGVATFSSGCSGQPPSRKKDPALLLGAGWEGGGEDVAVAVWWDFENCNVPLGIEVYKVAVNIVSGLRVCGFKGPVSISAYGDTLQLSRSSQEALASTGIQLHHIPSGGKNSSDRALLVDLILWTVEHPPPVHLFLISGDRDFSNALHRLRMMNYNILLACPAGTIVSPALLGAATQVWQWNSLVRGEGLLSATPSHDPRPPDGPSGGGSTARQTAPKPYSPPPLYPGLRGPDGNGQPVDIGGKNSFPSVSPLPTLRPNAAQELSKSPDAAANPNEVSAPSSHPSSPLQGVKASDVKRESPEEVKLSSGPSSDSILQEVPSKVLQQFRNILASHPNGITLSNLQAYILKQKLLFPKDYYGHGKIVPFLSSIPHVVQIERVLLKDNKSWSYLLKSPPTSVQSKQKGSAVTADKTNLIKPPVEEKVVESNVSQQGKTKKVSDVVSSSNEQPPQASPADHGFPAPQPFEDDKQQLERSRKEVLQLNVESSETSAQVEPLDHRDADVVDERAPSPMSTFRRSQTGQKQDNNSSFSPQVSSPVSDRNIRSPNLDQKDVVLAEDCVTNSLKVEDKDRGIIELDRVVGEGITCEPLVDDTKKQRLCVSEEDSDKKLQAVCYEVTSSEEGGQLREKIRAQETTIAVDHVERKDSERSWKTWLFGPIQEKPPSLAAGSRIMDSSVSPASYDLSDLAKLTWKDFLSWPLQTTQTRNDDKPASLTHASTDNEDRAKPGNIASSTTEGRNVKQEKCCNGDLLEDLKEYLCSVEGSAILSKSPDLAAIVDTIRETGPEKFHGLQSRQIAEVIDELAKAEEGFDDQFWTAPDAHSVRGGDEQEIIFPKEQGGRRKRKLEDGEFFDGSRHVSSKIMDDLSSNRAVEISSLSKIDVLKQEDQIRSPNRDSVPCRDPGSLHESSSASLNGTEAGSPSLGEFQKWFLQTVKEAYKYSERTKKIGFDLSSLKPDFEREFGVRLDPQVYGFVKLQDLVASISAIRVSKPRSDMCVVHLLEEGERVEEDQHIDTPKVDSSLKASKWPQMYHDCSSLVRELMLENPEGLPGSKLKPLFMNRFQYPLDHKSAGYQRMSDFLHLMPDVVSVNGNSLFPSEELLRSLKSEAMGKESKMAGDLILKDGNGRDGTCTQSRQDADLEKGGPESLESWDEIDSEENGGPSPSDNIGEAAVDNKIGLQDQHISQSAASKMLFRDENRTALKPVLAETNSEGKTELPERATFSGTAAEERRPELLSTCLPVNHECRDDANFKGWPAPIADSASLPVASEPLINVRRVPREVDEGSGDDLEPLVGSLQGKERHQSIPSDTDTNMFDKEDLLSIEEKEKGELRSSEEVFSTNASGDTSKVEQEGHSILVTHNRQGVKPETTDSFGVLGTTDQGASAESPPSSFNNTFTDTGRVGLNNVGDCRQLQECEVSQNGMNFEAKEETFDATAISASLEPVDTTPDGNANHLPNSLSRKEGSSVGLEADIPSDMESQARFLLDPKSSGEPCTEADSADDLSESSKEKIMLTDSEPSSTSMANGLATRGTAAQANLLEQSDGSDLLYHDRPRQEEECRISAVVSPHEEERLPAAAEGTLEGGKEGHHSGSTSSIRASLKSIWKRLFS